MEICFILLISHIGKLRIRKTKKLIQSQTTKIKEAKIKFENCPAKPILLFPKNLCRYNSITDNDANRLKRIRNYHNSWIFLQISFSRTNDTFLTHSKQRLHNYKIYICDENLYLLLKFCHVIYKYLTMIYSAFLLNIVISVRLCT